MRYGKRIGLILLAVLMLAGCLSAAADGFRWSIGDPIPSGFTFFHNDGYARIIDEGDLLTEAEEKELEARSSAIRSEHGTDLVVLTTNDLHGKNIMDVADDYYDYNGYGVGSDRTGILLVISVEPGDRQYWLSTCGSDIRRFKDEIEDMKSVLVSYLKNGRYGDAAKAFMDYVESVYTREEFDRFHDKDAPRVVDLSGVFTDQQKEKLEKKISEIWDKYEMDVLIMTVDSLRIGSDPSQYAFNYGYFNGYGYGSGYDLLTLVIDTAASGSDRCNVFYSGGGMTALAYESYEFVDRLGLPSLIGSNTGIANKFLRLVRCRMIFGQYPLTFMQFLIAAGIAFAIAWIIVRMMVSAHNSVAKSDTAAAYVVPGSFAVTDRHDYFVNSHVTKTLRPEPTSRSSGSGGGGGFHVSSSGSFHGGGGGHF
ncbi:MAG: TPM domain-containing protein [Lachnospiraceae bacterium]|nr:TPM domain-containing protein [Lachnospiraceae bacterium]